MSAPSLGYGLEFDKRNLHIAGVAGLVKALTDFCVVLLQHGGVAFTVSTLIPHSGAASDDSLVSTNLK